MRPAVSLVRKFVEKKMSSQWDSGFFYGALSSGLAFAYINHTKRQRSYPSQHTGDDCLYCKSYFAEKKPMI